MMKLIVLHEMFTCWDFVFILFLTYPCFIVLYILPGLPGELLGLHDAICCEFALYE